MSKAGIVIIAISTLLSGCSGGWRPWGSSDREQPQRLPEGAVELSCAQAKRLVLRYAADGTSVWIIFPDRQFRLDRVTASPAERYTNGATTLTVEGDGITLDVDGARQFSDCKKSQ